MNDNFLLFNFYGVNIRTFIINHVAWFVLDDICNALNIQNIDIALDCLDSDDKEFRQFTTPKGLQDVIIINECGLYSIIIKCNAPKVKEFKSWLMSIVLPVVRKSNKHVDFDSIEDVLFNPDFLINSLQAYKKEKARCNALEDKIEHDEPRVVFADCFEAHAPSILIKRLVKLLRQNGISISVDTLFKELRNRGFLFQEGENYNMPTPNSLELGLMEIVERSVFRGSDEVVVTRTAKVTGKGQVFFIHMFVTEWGGEAS